MNGSYPQKSIIYIIIVFFWVSVTMGQTPPPLEIDTSFVQSISPTSGAVAIKQVRFEFDYAFVRDSDWGQICIDPRSFLADTGLDAGYINMCMVLEPRRAVGAAAPLPELKWVIQNACVPKALVDACAADSTGLLASTPLCSYFDLMPAERQGRGRVDSMQAVVLVSSAPLPVIEEMKELWDTFPFDTFPVEGVIVNAEGDYGEHDEPANVRPVPIELPGFLGLPPSPPDPLPLPQNPSDLTFACEVFQTALPNIQCAKNQCVPMAHANMLRYLQDRYHSPPLAWWLAHDPIAGIGKIHSSADVVVWLPEPENSLVANVDAKTKRKEVFSASTGKGSGRCQQIRGVFGYLGEFGQYAQVTYRHQGGDPEYGENTTCDGTEVDLGGLVSVKEGLHPTWEWMKDQLQEGRGLVMSFGRYDIVGNRTSGHMVRVWGAACYLGKKYIFTLDDGDQGPNATGLRTQQWEVEDTGQPGLAGLPDGRLNMDGMSWEIEFAISAEALPTLIIP